MSIFPGGVDTFPTATTLHADTLDVAVHSQRHQDLGDAIVAIETALIGGVFAGVTGEYIDPSQPPYNCDMTGTTPNGTTHIGAGNGTAPDGSDATHGFMRAVYDAVTSGKELWIPPGTINMLRDDGVTPALILIDFSVHKRRVKIRGDGQDVSILKWPTGLGTVTSPTATASGILLGGDPSGRVANFAIDAANSNQTNWSLDISDLTLLGPGSYSAFAAPEHRTDGWGIHMGGRILVERCNIQGWHTPVVYRPRINDHNIDHNTIRDSMLANNFYNMLWSYYWPTSGMNAGDGDHVIENVMMSQAAKAVRAVDPAGQVFDSKISSCHGGFSPFGWYSENGPQSEVLLSTGTWPGASAVGTVARDSAGVITIDTKISAIAAPWGPFDNSDQPWNSGTIVSCGGFTVGDVIDLADIACSGHAAGSLATDAKCTGRVATKSGTVLTFTMEHPVTGSAFSATNITAGGLTSHYNQPIFLSNNVEHDGTYEGIGNSNIFAPNGIVRGFNTASTLPFHGLMSVDNNKGNDNAYSPTPMSSVVRDASGNVTGKVPAGTAMMVGDNWFINTPTAGTWADDNPPSSNWQPAPNRVRGVHNILTVTDNTDGGTTLTFTYNDGVTGHAVTIGNGSFTPSWDPTGHPQAGTAGSAGRCAAFVMSQMLNNGKPTFDISAHPPDKGSDGGTLAALELVVTNLRKSEFVMLQGQALYPRLMTGTTDTGSEPVRSSCVYGTVKCEITHTTQACTAGMILEASGRADVRPWQGGWLMGVALYNRQANDYIAFQSDGYLSSSDTGYPTPGVISTMSLSQGNIVVPDPSNHGYVVVKGTSGTTGFPVVGRIGSNSTSIGGGLFRSSIDLYIVNSTP